MDIKIDISIKFLSIFAFRLKETLQSFLSEIDSIEIYFITCALKFFRDEQSKFFLEEILWIKKDILRKRKLYIKIRI